MLPMLCAEVQSPSPLSGARLLWVGGGSPGLWHLLREQGAELRRAGSGEVSSLIRPEEVDAVLLELPAPWEVEAAIGRWREAGACVVAVAGPGASAALALEAGAAEVLPAAPAGGEGELVAARVRGVLRRRRQEEAQRVETDWLSSHLPAPAVRQRTDRSSPERLVATLLFSDLRGFTAASLTQDAAWVFDGINHILAAQMRCIQAAGGYVDGFSGDGLLALFEGPDSGAGACEAAAAILGWADQTALGPWPQLPVAMGLHRGEVVRGELGGVPRRVFTALGSPINLAARLCGVAGAREAVASQELIARLPPGRFRFAAPRRVQLKGVPAPLLVQSLLPAPRP